MTESTYSDRQQARPKMPLLSEDYRPLGKAVEEAHAGMRVDDYLAKQFPFLSRNQWQRRIVQSQVLLNQMPLGRVSYRLRIDDQFWFFHPQEAEPEVNSDLRILWQDQGVMGVYKPANLPMHENGRYRKNTFAHFLSERFGKDWAAVHRLDKETSGVVICSDSHQLRSQLSLALRQRDVYKRYLAIVCGQPPQEGWHDSRAIGDWEDSEIRIKKWVTESGLPAETRFQSLSYRKNHALVEAIPKTGRTNQIRIHLAASGFAILGDKLYHPDERVFLNYWQKGNVKEVAEMAGAPRLCLHAAEISFVHPGHGRRVFVESPLPDDLEEIWNCLAEH